MERPVLTAALALLWAGAVGLGLGAGYDLLRAPRLLHPRWTWLSDLLFGLGLGWGILYTALVPGAGELRVSHLAAMGLGFYLWRRTLGQPVLAAALAVLRRFDKMVRTLTKPLTGFFIFLRQLAKKYFSTGEK